MLVTCMLTVIWWAQWLVCSRSAAKGCPVPPKAGGPLYLYRLLANRPGKCAGSDARASGCKVSGRCAVESRIDSAAKCTAGMGSKSSRIAGVMYAIWRAGAGRNTTIAAGPTGERNTRTLLPRERVLCIADDEQDALTQLAAVLAVGGRYCGRMTRCIVS